ncbi:MAG TPA: DHA2 family efflux MFS transporter permease subunit [Gaiellaceae bacterium]|jgi:EmrB/QacA subfamily drug resistance transporter|nr:DHA2 family efflux MFS transporter permease subunit [Gaiellaceae bacterium]
MPDAPNRRSWLTLAVVGAAFFMTVLDVAIVNVAIPSIQRDLNIAEETVQWVITAYAITFGGFLLLGGRMADLLGRRRIFVVGLILFTAASLTCGLADSAGVLVASRAVQGLGAAIISPAALSIVTTTFTEGAERNKALGIWGALGGSGAAAGVLFGGILTKYLGWEWIFFVNVPVGALVFALTWPIVPESHAELGHRRFDAAGAVTVTGGLALFVYAISKAPDVGWGSTRTILLLVASAAMLAAFTLWELRTSAPLMPFRIFRLRSLAAANVVGFLLGAVIFANFFVLTLYVQQVLGWSALRTGLTFLATAGTTVIWAGVSQALVTRFGPRPVMVLGMLVLAASLGWYTQIPVDGHYWPDLLPAYITFALGLAFSFIPVSIAALSQVAPHEAGLASGLINTNQQIGGGIGVAVAATIFTSHANSLLASGHTPTDAFTSGYQHAFWALLAIALVGAFTAAVLLRGRAELPAKATADVPAV